MALPYFFERIQGKFVWKVYFPFDNIQIRSILDQLGMQYDPILKSWSLNNTTGLPDRLRALLQNMAFVVVKNAGTKDFGQPKSFTPSSTPSIDTRSVKKTVVVSAVQHRGERRIKVGMGYDLEAVHLLRSIEGAAWSKTMRCWHLPYNKVAYENLRELFVVKIDVKEEATESNSQQATDNIGNKTEIETSATTVSPLIAAQSNLHFPPDKITVLPHASNHSLICLQVPKELTEYHLATVKNIHGRRWNPDTKCWELPKTQITIRFLEKYLKEYLHWTFQPDITKLPERLIAAPAKPFLSKERPKARYEAAVVALEQCLNIKRFSHRTIKSYKNCFRNFIMHYNDIKPSEITRAQIDGYIHFLIKEKHITESFQNQVVSALLHFYLDVVKQEEKVERLFRPKKPQKLPHVLTEEEVVRLLNCVDNTKHKIILMLIYSAGLRLSEVVNLRIPDLQPEQNRLFVREGKGKKDRCTILSEKVKAKLLGYYELYQPCDWLFEGQSGGQYSVRSVQAIFENAKNKSKINQYATVHTLRHSFATHLLEKGVDLRYIQDLLGHESSKTTEIYTHITKKGIDKISSPLDHLDI